MFEAYTFFAAFVVQIVVVSVLHPAWVARYVRAKVEAQFPDRDAKSREGFLSLYRLVNAGIAVLGLVLLGWLFHHMRSPDWHLFPVMRLLAGYSMAQMLPLVLASLIAGWIKRKALLRSPPPPRRTASLQRRGLLDIVSPFTVVLAVAGYVLFAALMIHIQQHPVAGFSGYTLLGAVTLVYALNAFALYWLLYRRKRWPLETLAYRTQAVEVQVRVTFYLSIGAVAFLSLDTTLVLQHLMRWAPLAISVGFVIVMLFSAMMLFTLRHQAEADRLGPAS